MMKRFWLVTLGVYLPVVAGLSFMIGLLFGLGGVRDEFGGTASIIGSNDKRIDIKGEAAGPQ